jgi:acyl-CoA reductase-like NAD-dependent aldehyde dehydrogenase
MAKEIEMFVDGAHLSGARHLEVIEPARGSVALRLQMPTVEELDRIVAVSARMFEAWGGTPAYARADILSRLAREVEAAKATFVDAMIRATGKTRRDAGGEVDRSVETLSIVAEEARRIEGFEVPMDVSPRGVGRIAIVRRYPIGVVAAITPFNAPLNTACHKIGPALAAGNTVVHKPDVRGAEIAVLLAELAIKAGLPAGVLNVVHGDAEIGEALVRHRSVDVVGFTGSEVTGERILAIAGLKRVLLELGGNAPAIIHHDADVGRALKDLVPSSFGMSGQSCISTQRIFAHRSVYDAVLDGLVKGAKAMKLGEPGDPDVDIGPMITEDAAKRVESWIREAVAAGARLHGGGERRGAFLSPAVLSDVKPTMTVVCKEVFGPVVSVIPYDEVDAAIDEANSTPYGLQAGLYTNSLDLMLKAARRLRFGGVNVNAPSRWRLDNMPYGGVKRSGFGREGPKYAIEDMSELRQLVIG